MKFSSIFILLMTSTALFGMEDNSAKIDIPLKQECLETLSNLRTALCRQPNQSGFSLHLIHQATEISTLLKKNVVDTLNKQIDSKYNTLLHLITQQAIDLDRAMLDRKINIDPNLCTPLFNAHLELIKKLTESPDQRTALTQKNLMAASPKSMISSFSEQAPNVWSFFMALETNKIAQPIKNKLNAVKPVVDQDGLPSSDTTN